MVPTWRTYGLLCLIGVFVLGALFIITHRGSGTDVGATATAYVASQPKVGTTVAVAPAATPQPSAPQPAAQPPRLVQCLDGSTREVCPAVAPTATPVVPTSTPVPAPTSTPAPQQAAAASNTPVQQVPTAPTAPPVALAIPQARTLTPQDQPYRAPKNSVISGDIVLDGKIQWSPNNATVGLVVILDREAILTAPNGGNIVEMPDSSSAVAMANIKAQEVRDGGCVNGRGCASVTIKHYP